MKSLPGLPALLLSLLWLFAMFSGGSSSLFDPWLLAPLHGGAWPGLVRPAQLVTALGGWQFLIPVTVIAAVILYRRGERRNAAYLLAFTLWGRAVVDAVKWLTDRARPDLFERLAETYSTSFPSGHSANSTIVYCALALLLAPGSTAALAAALLLSLAIGLSRLVLGVHWPSDVVGGWALGLLWTLALHRLVRNGGTPSPSPSLIRPEESEDEREPTRGRIAQQ